MVKINVLIITYNQEDIIKRAIDSILCQKEYGLNKIVVSDDCSSDNTWNVLMEYKAQYPEIFVCIRNAHNLGIYGNWNQLINNRSDSDIYYVMAGDDELVNGTFSKVQAVVQRNKLDFDFPFAIYFDFKIIRANNEYRIYKNNAVKNRNNVFALKLRNRISSRSCFVSRGLMKNYALVDDSEGLALAESMADLQYSILSKQNYYESYVASIYYAGIGVSRNLFTKKYFEEALFSSSKLIEKFNLQGRDLYWQKYRMSYYKLQLHPTFSEFMKTLYFYILGEKYPSFKGVCLNLYSIIKEIFK